MKKKDLLTLRQKSIDELKNLVATRKIEFYNSYALLKASEEKNLKKSKNLRHEISQILTLIREKEILEEINKEDEGEKGVVKKAGANKLKVEKKNSEKKRRSLGENST